MFNRIKKWLEVRIGLDDLTRTQLTEYRVPKNVNIFATLGFVALAGYAIQVISGIFLLIYYTPHPDHAFRSVQDIMTRVPYGWLFRQMHVMGSNIMIAVVMLHMVTVFLMGNYKRPRRADMGWRRPDAPCDPYIRAQRLSAAMDPVKLLGYYSCNFNAYSLPVCRRLYSKLIEGRRLYIRHNTRKVLCPAYCNSASGIFYLLSHCTYSS